MLLVLIVLLVVLAVGGLPQWNYHALGYTPSGLLVVVLVVVLVLLLLGRL
jgi:Protein of unknown function (DUF3309)